MDTDLVKCLLITIIPYVFVLVIDRYNMKNKIKITNEEIKEALDLLLREQT